MFKKLLSMALAAVLVLGMGTTVGVRLPYDLPTTIHNLSLVKTYK